MKTVLNIQKDRKMKKVLFLSWVLLAFSVNAYAAGTRYYVAEPQYYATKAKTYHTTGARPYIGLDYVNSSADIDGNDFEDNLNAVAVSVGVRMHKNFGFEAFYQQSEEGEKSVPYGNISVKTLDEYKAYGVDFMGYLPLTNNLEALMSLGVAYYDAESYIKLQGTKIGDDDNGIGYRAGIGFQYNFDKNWSARIMGRYVDVDIEGLDHFFDITAGVRYHF